MRLQRTALCKEGLGGWESAWGCFCMRGGVVHGCRIPNTKAKLMESPPGGLGTPGLADTTQGGVVHGCEVSNTKGSPM